MSDKGGFSYGGPGDGNDHGSGDGSSSSSSSSGGGGDPRIAQLESLFNSIYIGLWGEPPTVAYVKAAAQQGMNTTEFEERERHKEAFKSTKTYQSEFKQFLGAIRTLGVA